ncbi:MAG: PilZ domain-containing protein [Oligoflexia bacterium]|nr:PilZ domain-containing protein [Oligoflexia bacterium]
MKFAEKRKHQRIEFEQSDLRLSIQLLDYPEDHSPSGIYPRNISRGGLKIQITEKIPMGCKVGVALFSINKSDWIAKITGKVVRTEETQQKDLSKIYGIAVQFDEILDDSIISSNQNSPE